MPMPEMASLTQITKRALLVFSAHRTLWWLALPIGIIIGISSFMTQEFRLALPPNTQDSSLWLTVIRSPHLFWYPIALLGVVVVQALFRGPLTAQLGYFLEKQAGTVPNRITKKDILRTGIIAVTFEGAYWLSLLLIACVLALPCFLAWRLNPFVLPAILELGFLLLFLLGIYLYFIKELACLYALLGRVRFSSAIELGFRLFRRQSFNTLLFFAYTALLALLFSLCMESLFRLAGFPVAEADAWRLILISLPFGLYFIFDQSLRVVFFRTIATAPKKPVPKQVVLETVSNPSSIAPN